MKEPGQGVRAVSNPIQLEIISAQEIAARPGQLKSQKNAFELQLAYCAPKEEPDQTGAVRHLPSLILYTAPLPTQPPGAWSGVSITEAEAVRIIDHLQAEGFVADAVPLSGDTPRVDGPAYSLTVMGSDKLAFYEPLGWGLKTLDRLEGLRSVLEGAAAKAMDQLLAALEPHRAEWEAGAKWGQAVEGVQVRLRPRQSTGKLGVPPGLLADVRNLGNRHLRVYGAVNFWTSSEVEVDGRWYRRPLPTHDYRPPMSNLVPGRQLDPVHVSLDHWWEIPASPSEATEAQEKPANEPERLKLTPGKHTVRVAVTATAGANEAGEPVRAVSNPVEIEIVPGESPSAAAAESDWGAAVEGVQLRMRAEKPTWPRGSLPKLFADLRNQGTRTLRITLESESWELEIDRTWHRTDTLFSGDILHLPLAPGQEQRNIEVWMADVDNLARKLRALEPGKHTLRVARIINATQHPRKDVFRVVSNAIEIEVVPGESPSAAAAESDWGPVVEGVQCRVEPEKRLWKARETPMCRAFVRHQGTIEVWLSRVQVPQSGLEVDGVWYRPQDSSARSAYQRSSLWEKDAGGFRISLDPGWVAVEGGQPLALGPGEHTVRYAWAGFHAVYRPRISPVLYDEDRPVRLVSKAVEIEIAPGEPTAGTR